MLRRCSFFDWKDESGVPINEGGSFLAGGTAERLPKKPANFQTGDNIFWVRV